MTIATDRPPPALEDRLITLPGSWEHFKLIQRGCEQSSGLRLFYFDRTIEILMPGQTHEIFSHAIGVLLTLFLAHQGILFVATGAADQEREGIAAAQPDQSYCIGKLKPIPDLSIEVVFASGGPRKLNRYQALGVPEVWFWEDGTLALYHLRSHGYERIQHSELAALQTLDLNILQRYILQAETDLGAAIRAFTAWLNTQQEHTP